MLTDTDNPHVLRAHFGHNHFFLKNSILNAHRTLRPHRIVHIQLIQLIFKLREVRITYSYHSKRKK